MPSFAAATTSGIPAFVVMSAGAADTSQSWKSPLIGWTYPWSWPVRASSASTEFVYRFSPGLSSITKSGPGLPVVTYSVLVTSSSAYEVHVAPPVGGFSGDALGQVARAGPESGTTLNCHIVFPDAASSP